MKKIKAIETRYKGYRFRSRLEARWAVFFDALGIKYKYEEYGFESGFAEDNYKWLPDFYLPDSATWVEVKGGRPTPDDAEKMAAILDYSSPVPFFSGSNIPRPSIMNFSDKEKDSFFEMGASPSLVKQICRGLILLGDIPEINHGIVIHPIITHQEGLCREGVEFNKFGPRVRKHDELIIFKSFNGRTINMMGEFMDGYGELGSEFSRDYFTPDFVVYDTELAHSPVCKAYQKARSARFEHGEAP